MHILTRLIVILFFCIVLTPYCYSEELRILCWEGYAPGTHTKQFEQFIKNRYDIDLKVVVKDVSDPKEFFYEIRAKNVDLISPAHNIPKSHQWNLIRGKLVLPINLENIPNYQYIIPALKKAEYITQDDKIYGVPIVYGPYGLAYNTSLVKKEPKSWNVFWEKNTLVLI